MKEGNKHAKASATYIIQKQTHGWRAGGSDTLPNTGALTAEATRLTQWAPEQCFVVFNGALSIHEQNELTFSEAARYFTLQKVFFLDFMLIISPNKINWQVTDRNKILVFL